MRNKKHEETANKDSVLISDEQRLIAKLIEDDSFYFHSEDKGCTFYENVCYRKKGPDVFKRCLLHDAICCRCGWQIGFHYNKRT